MDINKEVMPIVNDIKSKINKLEDKYKFKIDFAFTEITKEDIMGEDLDNSQK